MKIASIEPILCHAYRANWFFVRVLTDIRPPDAISYFQNQTPR